VSLDDEEDTETLCFDVRDEETSNGLGAEGRKETKLSTRIEWKVLEETAASTLGRTKSLPAQTKKPPDHRLAR